MRISELSQTTGVSTATIKYYVREGLLPEPARLGYNTTDYAEAHVSRLRLIRAMIETGGRSVAAVGRVLAAVDDESVPLSRVLGTAQQSLPMPAVDPSPAAVEVVRGVMRERGWAITAANPGIALAAATVDGFAALGRSDVRPLVSSYAQAVAVVAEADLDNLEATGGDRAARAETVAIGIPLGDRLLAGLRRIAQESLSLRRYAGGVVPTEDAEPPEPNGESK